MGRSRVGHESNRKKESHHADQSCCSISVLLHRVRVFGVVQSSTSDGIQRRQHGSRRFGQGPKVKVAETDVEHEQGERSEKHP